MPGLVLLAGPPGRCAGLRARWDHSPLREGFCGWHGLGGWLYGGIVGPRGGTCELAGEGRPITALVEGYLADCACALPAGASAGEPAAAVAALYRRDGLALLPHLRGSFTALVLDHAAGTAVLWSDRLGSRPLFMAEGPGGLHVLAPQVSTAALLAGRAGTLHPAGFAELLVRGGFYGDHTLFPGVRRFPQAGVMELSRSGVRLRQYWAYRFQPTGASEADLVDEADGLLRRAARRTLAVVHRPLVALSGGLDSRVMLAYLRAEGAAGLEAFSYGSRWAPGNDREVARRVAAAGGMPCHALELDPAAFADCAARAVWRADCRVEVLDAPQVLALWEGFQNRCGGFIQGDQCFGWGRRVANRAEALETLRWWNLDRARRVADWLAPELRAPIRREIARLRRRLIRETGAVDPNDLKDELFYRMTLGNRLNAFGAAKLAMFEQFRPLLDEDVIDLVMRLPVALRAGKRLLRRVLERHPELAAMPLARGNALPSPEVCLRQARADARARELLLEDGVRRLDPRVERLLDGPWYQRCMEALLACERLPAPRGPGAGLPLLWRLRSPENNRVHPYSGLLRVLAVNLYLQGPGFPRL